MIEKGNFYIRNKPVVIIDNNIVVDDEDYKGTSGLWELIVSKNQIITYTYDDYDNYARLMLKSNTLYRNNDPEENHPKSSKGQNWKEYLKLFGIIGKGMKEAGLLLFRAILTRC